MLKEFRAFILRGNVIDLAVGIIIGAAFGRIVNSLVNDILMPVLGFITGGMNFSDQKVVLKAAVLNPDGSVKTPANTINWGMFIQATIEFLIIGFALFIIIKALNSIHKKQAEVPAAVPPAPSTEEKLLMEIRDLLKK
ncbi:MAG: large-conductance mechanosensitive channel protein MscL [Chitinophagales bacterium]|nr:large-conductance mechanosensitive channel protein MscL [Chitinophagales bacterium]